jgi:hypothetical protein
MPRHADILEGLTCFKKLKPRVYSRRVQPVLRSVFDCELVAQKTLPPHRLPSGLSVEALIMCTKWLFIEQDITYWNWSGRQMFFDKLFSDGLV